MEENASREFTYKKTNENIDTSKETKNLQIKAFRVSKYVADSHETGNTYYTIIENVASYRKTSELGNNLSQDINKNTNKKVKI